MKIERLKSILLIILVISSIVLTANKWFREELWPEGYSFFSSVKNRLYGSDKDNSNDFSPNEEVLKPAKIILNNLNNHVLYTKSSEKYDSLSSEITKILDVSLVSDLKTNAKKEEWNNHLKAKSCYFSYPVIYDATYFASQLSKEYKGNIKYFREFILANDQRIPSIVYLYIKDAKTDEIEKIRTDFDFKNIELLINNAQNESQDINYYSFELNFHAEKDSEVKNHVVIDNDVLINISEKMVNKISEKNLFYNIVNEDTLYSQILSLFEYNTSSIRKYVESDNSMVFVENYGTLKLHSNGLLDYKSLEKTKGISLDDSSVNACLNSCITFVNNVTELMGKNKTMYYEISSDIHDIKSRSFTMTFDYYINDNKIIIPKEKFNTQNAITVEVENGKIVSYTQLFVSYTALDEQISCGSAIDAIDMLEPHKNSDTKTISDIFAAYSFDTDKKIWIPHWFIEDSEGNVSTISSKTEVQ